MKLVNNLHQEVFSNTQISKYFDCGFTIQNSVYFFLAGAEFICSQEKRKQNVN